MGDENLDERTVEVLQIPDKVDDDLLWLYFEGRRSGGGEISSLDRNKDKAIIVFERAEDAANVLSKDSHTLCETKLLVRKKPPKDKKKFLLRGLSSTTSQEILELFVENLTGVDAGTFTIHQSVEKDLVLVDLQEPLAEGFQKVREKVTKKTLDGVSLSLEEVEYTDSILVENLPPSVSEDLLILYFESPRIGGGEVTAVSMSANGTAKVSFKDSELVNAVVQKPHKLEDTDLIVKPYYSFLSVEENTPSAASDQMVEDEHQAAASTSSTAEENTSQDVSMADVSTTSPRSAIPPFTTPAPPGKGSSPETSMEYVSQGVSPDPVTPVCHNLSVPDPAKLKLLASSDLLGDLRNAYPNFEIAPTQDGVDIKGPGRDQAEKIKNKLLEFVSGSTQAHVPISELKSQFLQREKVKQRLASVLKDNGVTCTYTVSGGTLVMTSTSVQALNKACEVITGQLVETVLPVESRHECMIYTQEWRHFLTTQDCCAQVSGDAKCIVLVALKDEEKEIRSRMDQFLSTPIQIERVLSMEPAMLEYIQLHHQQLLMDMGEVVIFPLDTGDGLSIQGDAMMCHNVWELLSGIISGTLTKNLTVKQPGIARFLLQDEGASILGEMTVKFQVYISLEKVHWEPLKEQDVLELAWKMTSSQNFRRTASVERLIDLKDNSHNEARLQEARRILANVGSDRSSEPSSLRATGMEEDVDLYSGADQEMEDPTDESIPQTENSSTLDEDAGLLLAIQLSMEESRNSVRFADDDLQKVLELSRNAAAAVDESSMLFQAISDSLQDSVRSANVGEIKVFASYPHDLVRVDIALGKKVGQRQCEEKLEHTCFRKLSSIHRRCLDLIRRKHAVDIQIQGTSAVVSGFRDYVSEALPDLHELMKKAADAVTDAEILRTVQWVRHQQGGGAVPYSPEAIVYMENAWRAKQKKIDILFDGQPYTIDFERMQEYSVSSGCSEQVSRRMVSSLDLYTEFQEDYSLISDVPDAARLEENSAEYNQVVEEFKQSIRGNKFKIIQVEKLMNRLLYSQYRLKKVDLEQRSMMTQVERTLYHGTSESSVKEICIHGFNRSFCGKNATVYGQGVYFAVQSSLSFSDTYSPPNADGHKFIFVAKVLTGEYTVGTNNMRAAPLKESSGIPDRYHSVADRMDDPSLFVIFNDTQAYPQYLITCQKIGA
ncbi:uncharacterized protein parp10 isoform X2 [Trichomycterus rosablanca]|uniref:uncharacterized protein parp10 isoform X2 n=1 Tax=Trichomycterus rosablanca TaxID=2290929 RepID=UPI002F35AE99